MWRMTSSNPMPRSALSFAFFASSKARRRQTPRKGSPTPAGSESRWFGGGGHQPGTRRATGTIGRFLMSGYAHALTVHAIVAFALEFGALIQAVAAIVLWRRRRVPA
jgi:hypothetical protein